MNADPPLQTGNQTPRTKSTLEGHTYN
jgi:hypothetical protein